MPATTMIGESRNKKDGLAVLPPYPRSACRLLRIIGSAEVAASALLDAIEMITVRLPSPSAAVTRRRKKKDDQPLPFSLASTVSSLSCLPNHDKEEEDDSMMAESDLGGNDDNTEYVSTATAVAAASELATHTLQSLIAKTLSDMGRNGWKYPPGMAENRMSIALLLCVEKAVDAGFGRLSEDDEAVRKMVQTEGGEEEVISHKEPSRRNKTPCISSCRHHKDNSMIISSSTSSSASALASATTNATFTEEERRFWGIDKSSSASHASPHPCSPSLSNNPRRPALVSDISSNSSSSGGCTGDLGFDEEEDQVHNNNINNNKTCVQNEHESDFDDAQSIATETEMSQRRIRRRHRALRKEEEYLTTYHDTTAWNGGEKNIDEQHRRDGVVKYTMATALESLHLQVASRTIRTWGKRKIYEIYALPTPVRSDFVAVNHASGASSALSTKGKVSTIAVEDLRKKVEREFRTYYRGGGEDRCGCRTYALVRQITKGKKRRRHCRNESAAAAANLCDDDEESDHDSEMEYGGVLRSIGTSKDVKKKKNKNTSGGDKEEGDRSEMEAFIYLQLNIGKPLDLHDESLRARSGEKKKKKATEYVALFKPGESLFALTASRSASNSPYTPFVLAALEGALCSLVGSSSRNSASREAINKPGVSTATTRVGDLSGTDPHDLLKSALAAQNRRAVGRYARFASESSSSDKATGVETSRYNSYGTSSGTLDPLLELNVISSGNLVGRNVEQQRLKTGSEHGRSIATLSTTINSLTGRASSLVAANSAGLIVDHSHSSKQSRKRTRRDNLGDSGDTPCFQRICWKWSGETSAASLCWKDEDGNKDDNEDSEPTAKTKFKCGVVFEGPNVFEGIRALMDAGFCRAPLPNYVRDAPMLGSTTITVDHGEFGADSFAAV